MNGTQRPPQMPQVPAMRIAFSQMGLVLIDYACGDEFRGEQRFGEEAREFYRDEGFEIEVSPESLMLVPQGAGSKLLVNSNGQRREQGEVEVWNISGELLATREEGTAIFLTPTMTNMLGSDEVLAPNTSGAFLVDGLLLDLTPQSKITKLHVGEEGHTPGEEVSFW